MDGLVGQWGDPVIPHQAGCNKMCKHSETTLWGVIRVYDKDQHEYDTHDFLKLSIKEDNTLSYPNTVDSQAVADWLMDKEIVILNPLGWVAHMLLDFENDLEVETIVKFSGVVSIPLNNWEWEAREELLNFLGR